MKILDVFELDGVFDRYTLVTDNSYDLADNTYHDMLGLSDNPDSPQGFSQFSGGDYTPNGDNSHLGKRIKFSDLPENVQKHAKARLA
jgi:hypothetical protein